jgi:hypothetical protein
VCLSPTSSVDSDTPGVIAFARAAAAFDKMLCDRFGVLPLEFDRRTDSIFQPYDRSGRRHMEYLLDRGAGEPVTRFREEARARRPR